ncbi:WYL domain-containing protein [Niallia oryzisoli]|uniref:WYL domain-containing protein n=1 Tax=Niallia oryzisoli TaxID=1737571 RepID=A0ABZ2CKY1_9BACI
MSEIKTGMRLLALQKVFLRETDENHQLSIKELIEKLRLEIPDCTADAKAVKRYIHTLQEAGIDIIENVEKFGEKKYSHQARLFESYQLRLLVDPILSARFITEEEKKNIIQNVKKLTSEHIAKTLPDPIVYHQSINQEYQLIKLHIDQIHEALSESKMITFQYGDWGIEKEFKLRHNGKLYQIKPHALIWESDFYYLIGDDVKYSDEKNPRNYRYVTITEDKFTQKRTNLSTYVQNSFHMFGGQDEWITLKFKLNQSILNGVIDKFGIDVDLRKVDDEYFLLKAKAKLSQGLKGWILAWGSQVEILSPQKLIDEIKDEFQKMRTLYK